MYSPATLAVRQRGSECSNRTSSRPRALVVRTFRTLDFSGLPDMISAFLDAEARSASSIASACFGVAGPVAGDVADLTNVPWHVDASRVARAFGLARVNLLNDLEALAYALPALVDSEVRVLQTGRPASKGSIAVIAAGTGLGEAVLHCVDGRYRAHAMEAGHADFAARSDRDVTVLRDLSRRRGRASVEDVVSGPGLTNIYRALHGDGCAAGIDLDAPTASEAISTAALAGRCAGCVEVLDAFVEAYRRRSGKSRAADHRHRRRVRRRRHRAEDSSGARERALHDRVSREGAVREDAGSDAGEGDPQRGSRTPRSREFLST